MINPQLKILFIILGVNGGLFFSGITFVLSTKTLNKYYEKPLLALSTILCIIGEICLYELIYK